MVRPYTLSFEISYLQIKQLSNIGENAEMMFFNNSFLFQNGVISFYYSYSKITVERQFRLVIFANIKPALISKKLHEWLIITYFMLSLQ